MEPSTNSDTPSIEGLVEKMSQLCTNPHVRKYKWPYYKEPYALAVKEILDKMEETKGSRRVLRGACQLSTISNQYYQGVHYLLDKLDPTGKYMQLYLNSRMVKHPVEGYFEIVPGARFKRTAAVGLADAGAGGMGWKDDLIIYLEDPTPGRKYVRNDVALSPSEIEEITSLLEPFGVLFIAKITTNSILIVHDPEGKI